MLLCFIAENLFFAKKVPIAVHNATICDDQNPMVRWPAKIGAHVGKVEEGGDGPEGFILSELMACP